MTYDLTPMKAPRTAGASLKLITAIVESAFPGALLTKKLLRDAGVLALRDARTDDALLVTPPGLQASLQAVDGGATGPAPMADQPALAPDSAIRPSGDAPEQLADFAEAFRSGRLTPSEVAERVLTWARESDAAPLPLRVFIAQNEDDVRRQAADATERHRAGRALGLFDGVPVAVKDELDQRGYPTTVGTAFLGKSPATEDASVVARLRAAGAVLIGKTNMHEIGLGVTGVNPHHGACRNPHDPTRVTGGSSSGPAAAVAAGFCPVAVGADGGGSIRIPAALCGVVGIKPTFGRVSEHGAAPLCWSVAHVGPIATAVQDLAAGFAVMAGPDSLDPNTLGRPPVNVAALAATPSLAGLRVGVFRPYFDDAEPDVVRVCRNALDALVAAGATLVEVSIAQLGLLRAAHLVTIISEMAASHSRYLGEPTTRYGYDVRLNLALARRLAATDYVQAQRLRVGFARDFGALYQRIDVLATPATGRTAPLIPPDALATGESNLAVTDQILRFALPANVLGYPAISVPAGYDSQGLPVGFQLMGRPWEDAALFAPARVVEAASPRKRPKVHRSLLT